MSIHLSEPNLSFFMVPKCGSTTLKQFAYTLQNGARKEDVTSREGLVELHQTFPTQYFDESVTKVSDDTFKVAVVRDPVSRVTSFYGNRVVYDKMLDGSSIKRFGGLWKLKGRPTISEFVAHIDRYRKKDSRVKQHTDPLSAFLGKDAAFFDLIVPVNQMGKLHDALSQRFGDIPDFERLKACGPKIGPDALTQDEIKKIKRMYEEDYDLFGNYFN